MKQYCRYCSHCIGLDEEHGYCEEKNKMIKKTSIKNACTGFAFCEVDAFYYNRSDNPEEATYKPRVPKKKDCDGQMSLFEESRQQALIAGVELGKDYNLNVAPEDIEKYLEITGADKVDTTETCI